MQSKTGKPAKDAAARRERLAKQLRANLRRRKQQAEGRVPAAAPDPDADTPPPKSPGSGA
jgi:hypothetical protein